MCIAAVLWDCFPPRMCFTVIQVTGTFVDVTLEMFPLEEKFYGMGALWVDYDGDGWPDIFVADDSTPNKLYRNKQDGTFTETALLAGVAYSGEGVEQGCWEWLQEIMTAMVTSTFL